MHDCRRLVEARNSTNKIDMATTVVFGNHPDPPPKRWSNLKYDLWRLDQLLMDRVDIGTDVLKLRFRDKGLAQMVTEVGIMTGKSRREAA